NRVISFQIGSLLLLMADYIAIPLSLTETLSGSLSEVTNILASQKNLNLDQVRALANRCSVSPSVFI
ncbi:MAG: hypothetical protein ACR2FS_17225, partial [Phormidesmis sp.]